MAQTDQQQFIYRKAEIINETKGFTIDVKASIVELELFENITRLGVTGRVLIVDSQNVFNKMNFTGTETFELELDSSATEEPIRKTFIMNKVEGTQTANESNTAYVFSLIEKHVFLSKLQKISKSYTGTPIQIMNNILTGFLDIELDKTLLKGAEPAQETISLITPYINPIEAVQWVGNRSTTERGFPYFLYGTLRSDKTIINSLENMNASDVVFTRPFVYSTAAAASDDALVQIFSLKRVETRSTDDMLGAMISGAVGSRFEVLDTVYGSTNDKKQFKISEVLETDLYDTEFEIKDKKIDEYESSIIFDITAPTYETFNGYGYNKDVNKLNTKIANRSLYTALQKNHMVIELDGSSFFANPKAVIGNRISIEYVQTDGSSQRYIDEKRSGDFIILTTKHKFIDSSHVVVATVTKV